MSNADRARMQEIRMKVTLAAAASSSKDVRDFARHTKPLIELLQSLIDRIEKLEERKP